MPKREDLKSVLVIGSGPIVIGQACEFDYSGTQACRVLRAEGLRVSLVNSNPATIMTDPEFADATYVEPITPEFVEMIIAKERPDALLATLGGSDGAEHRGGAARGRCAGEVQRRAHRGEHRGDSGGGEPAAVQGDRRVGRRGVGPLGDLPQRRRLPRCDRRTPLPRRRPALVHDGWRRIRDRLRREPTCGGLPARACRRARPPRYCSRNRSSDGKSTNSS